MAKIKVIAATGLVPVKSLVASTTTAPGDVFGVSPQRLASLLAKEQAVLVAIGDDVETYEVEVRIEQTADATLNPADDGDEFVLPDGWRELHHTNLIRLAKKIDPEVTTKAGAIAVLEAHEATLNPAE